ncbi:MAG TPA: DUF72 domain-containing protein [Nitrososphaera sp.]|nr:DUF72 domain-containing protein [Nitrososphaera sp.]
MAQVLVGCSGWNYGDPFEKGGWVGSFYPDSREKRLSYYSRYFQTAELDATFYEKFYAKMAPGTFFGMVRATPDGFQFSVKVPETVTHKKRLDLRAGAADAIAEFLERIDPLRRADKLGAVLIQLPPSFTVREFRQAESFLDSLPRGYEYAVEFRHPSWETEGPWELLKHYNVAGVLTDSPDPELQFLSEISVTADHAFIRLHGRNAGFWYNYLYNKEELAPWADKVRVIQSIPGLKTLRIYFNNHYGAGAVENALEFREMLGDKLSAEELATSKRIREAIGSVRSQKKIADFP